MSDPVKPHHVSLCILLRAFLDTEALQVRVVQYSVVFATYNIFRSDV